jgi:hypothetical protein
MYGYDLPRYVREKDAELKRYDRFLRIRRSLDVPGTYCVERKTRYLTVHPCERGTDQQVWYKDDYRLIFRFWPCDINEVMPFLERQDIQKIGAKRLANLLDAQDEFHKHIQEKDRIAEFEAHGSEAYDFLAWREGRRIAT